MAISRVTAQDCNNVGASGAVTCTYPSATTAGHLLICAVMNPGANTPAMSGWVLMGTSGINSGNQLVAIFAKISGGDTTAPVTGGNGNVQAHAYEYQGNAPAAVVETSTTSTSGASSVASLATTAITTADAGALIFMVSGQGSGVNGGSAAWTTATILQANAQTKLTAAQHIPGTTLTAQTYTASWLTARTASTLVVSIRSVTGGAIVFAMI